MNVRPPKTPIHRENDSSTHGLYQKYHSKEVCCKLKLRMVTCVMNTLTNNLMFNENAGKAIIIFWKWLHHKRDFYITAQLKEKLPESPWHMYIKSPIWS